LEQIDEWLTAFVADEEPKPNMVRRKFMDHSAQIKSAEKKENIVKRAQEQEWENVAPTEGDIHSFGE
jgi:hypothetical protein